MNRRGFIGSILALGAAPAIVRAESLMRVVGLADDTAWIQSALDTQTVVTLIGRRFTIKKALFVPVGGALIMNNCQVLKTARPDDPFLVVRGSGSSIVNSAFCQGPTWLEKPSWTQALPNFPR